MFYDLHIHSCLSPCADDDMTPNNIVNMAKLGGLDCISVTDHNSFAQQRAVKKCCEQMGLSYIYGVEVQTIEDVHVLCYFQTEAAMVLFEKWLSSQLLPIQNDVGYFGHQYILNELDEIVSEETILLLQSIQASIDEVEKQCHLAGGYFALAHVLDRSNSITTQLGFIPENLNYDAIEIKQADQIERVKKMHPHLKPCLWLNSSDAHQLVDIHEADYSFDGLWRDLK